LTKNQHINSTDFIQKLHKSIRIAHFV